MLLLISDANILLDMETGGLIAPMFSLGYDIAVPDVLYAEELEDRGMNLPAFGLRVLGLTPEKVQRVQVLVLQYPRAGRNDMFALVLAQREACPLVTGDQALRAAAETENVQVRGTLWLVEEMVAQDKIRIAVAREAYARMRATGRRLPWDDAEHRLQALERNEEGNN